MEALSVCHKCATVINFEPVGQSQFLRGMCPNCNTPHVTDKISTWVDNFNYIATHRMDQTLENSKTHDPINHPKYYTSHPSGVECIDIIESMPYNIGAAIKYLWRADLKHSTPIEDLKKAVWYIQREIQRQILVNETKQNG